MLAAIADTHTVIWYLFSDSRLGREASQFIDNAISEGRKIGISSITLAEMVYLSERCRIPYAALEELTIALTDPTLVLQEIPVDAVIVKAMASVSRDQIPDLPDRLIAATAHFHGVPLISRDRRIKLSSITTIW